MRNLILRLAYDGTNYHGFQRQPEKYGPTVQGVLEGAWKKLFAEELKLTAAGRTDAGVHAAGQVVNFMTAVPIPREKLPKAMNSILPRDIRILEAFWGEPGFSARMSALWKRYDYCIDNGRIPDVFSRLYAWHEPQPLDLEGIKLAASYLEGTHNFRAFAAAGTSVKSFVRTLYHCKVIAQSQRLTIVCVGDGFLYNMVRIIVGTLLAVGKKKMQPATVADLLARGDRMRAGMTVAPHGLTLTHVHYLEQRPSEVFADLPLNALEERISSFLLRQKRSMAEEEY